MHIGGGQIGGLLLEHVLHVPTAVANLVSTHQLLLVGWQILLSPYDGASELRHVDANRHPIKLLLVEHNILLEGAHPFIGTPPDPISLFYQWTADEQRRWIEHQVVSGRRNLMECVIRTGTAYTAT